MTFTFKVWNQGNDGETMGIRVANVDELSRFAPACDQADIHGNYQDLEEYLDAAADATSPPEPYRRRVDVIWQSGLGYGQKKYFPGRAFEVLQTGRQRQSGGYASQAYVIVDPSGHAVLSSHHQEEVEVEYISHPVRDVLIVS